MAVPASWAAMADAFHLPTVDGLSAEGPVHPEYEHYDGDYINQADVALLQYPLELDIGSRALAVRDLEYYQSRTSVPGVSSGFFTGDSAYSVAWLRLGNRTGADDTFDEAFEHMDLTGFNVWR